jgi:hypothetical protein
MFSLAAPSRDNTSIARASQSFWLKRLFCFVIVVIGPTHPAAICDLTVNN